VAATELVISDLHVSVEDRQILKGLNLKVNGGQIHAVMGPNGSGKSTLAYTLMGHPRYEVTSGDMVLNGKSILPMATDERSRAGLFLAFQYPAEVPGVSVTNFLRTAVNARRASGDEIPVMQFAKQLRSSMNMLEMEASFAGRYLNEGFSGGEKKRNEILQMAMLSPQIVILDEIDSGLDIDALRIVSNGVNQLRNQNMGVVVITHYQRILRYLEPDTVHVLMDGRIVRSGDRELAEQLEEKGYEWIRQELNC
jgi:Fe-S cluster assembly ATP-binding protein